jgi:hypothetical protein
MIWFYAVGDLKANARDNRHFNRLGPKNNLLGDVLGVSKL